MEEEKKKTKEVEIKTKSPMWVVVLVAVLVIALACEFVYIWKLKNTAENKNNTNVETSIANGVNMEEENVIEEKANTKTYTYDNIKGTYEVTKKFKTGEDSDVAYYDLYLYADGTYVYDYVTELAGAPFGIMGNYMINGNEIILNKLFSHGSDVGVTKDKGQIKLTINNDGSLTDKNNLLEDNKLKNVKLQKKSTSISKDVQSLSNYVGGYISYLEDEAFK